jgi:hypothetical protein
MRLDSETPIEDYKGEWFKVDDKTVTMKDLALQALEMTKIEDPTQSELAGIAMQKIYADQAIEGDEIPLMKMIMMAVFHQRILGYISKQFENGNINTEG